MTTIWHSDQLPQRFPEIRNALKSILERHVVAYAAIPGTSDIWCRDYMPVRATDGSLTQFVYWPRYLRARQFSHLITTPDCYRDLSFRGSVRKSAIVLDGGGVEICGAKGIVTERVFEDNSRYPREYLLDELKDILKLSELIVIPVEPVDETGHVDGVVRFVDERRVVMNDYTKLGRSLKNYGQGVERLLKDHGLHIDKIPYAPTEARGPDGMPVATGCYINFLRVDHLLVLPQFSITEDAPAKEACRSIFGEMFTVEAVDCSNLAQGGGVLNCVSWQD